MKSWSVPVLGVMLLLPLAAPAQQQIDLSVQNIPASATRVVAVVDGGGISGALRASQDVAAGTGSSSLALGVPSGGPYRVRVIAFTAGSVFPAILRTGKVTGIGVASGSTVNAPVSLADVSFAVDASTPASANDGENITVKIDITDSGDCLDGISFGELWSGTKSPTQNLTGVPTTGPLKNLGNGNYQFNAAVNLPANGTVFNFQFEGSSFAFANPSGTEAPILVWPNLQPGLIPTQIPLSSTSGISLTVTNIPTNATRVVAVVDTGANTGSVRASQDVQPGAGASSFFVDLPPGTGYRIRVVAFVSGSTYPAILRSGETIGIGVTSGGTTGTSVILGDVTGAVDPSSPSSAVAGQSLLIKINLTDPGNYLEAVWGGWLYTYASPPSQNPPASSLPVNGFFSSTSSGAYQFSTAGPGLVNAPPQAGTLYYQLSALSSVFSSQDGQENPSLVWPNLQTGAQLPQITVTAPNQLFVSVSNIPAAATSLSAVVDGGGIGSLPISQTISPGVGSSSISVALPGGGPYRIRVIATNNSYVLGSGKMTGILVSSGGSNNASVTLADVSGSLDPSTPTSGAAGASVTIKLNLTDPGEFLDGLTSGRLWYSSNSFSSNLPTYAGSFISGTIASANPGAYQFTAVANLPTSGGTLYYQFGETAPNFNGQYLVWPNVQAGAPPAQISVIGPLSITSLSPSSVTAGGLGFSLTVNGTGFVAGSTVMWNGFALSTTVVSGVQLTASVPASFILAPGTTQVTVSNPSGAVSNAVSFTVNSQTLSISALSPNTVVAGGAGFNLTVFGSGFLPGATVQWTGLSLTTVFVSGNQLTASVSAGLIGAPATEAITVTNPGGGLSNNATFTITASTPTAPSIGVLSPNSAPAGGPAFTLTVTGSGFVGGRWYSGMARKYRRHLPRPHS